MSTKKWQQKLPMQLTMGRIFLVVPVLACLYPNTFELNLLASVLFVIASITDYYDGYFARKFQAVSTLGKFMDPIADKILVNSILVVASFQHKIDPYLVILVISRDTFIGGIRAIAAADGLIIDAKPTGKWKAALQMGSIPAVLLWNIPGLEIFSQPIGHVGYILLWVSTVLSITSGVEYYLAFQKSRLKG